MSVYVHNFYVSRKLASNTACSFETGSVTYMGFDCDMNDKYEEFFDNKVESVRELRKVCSICVAPHYEWLTFGCVQFSTDLKRKELVATVCFSINPEHLNMDYYCYEVVGDGARALYAAFSAPEFGVVVYLNRPTKVLLRNWVNPVNLEKMTYFTFSN